MVAVSFNNYAYHLALTSHPVPIFSQRGYFFSLKEGISMNSEAYEAVYLASSRWATYRFVVVQTLHHCMWDRPDVYGQRGVSCIAE